MPERSPRTITLSTPAWVAVVVVVLVGLGVFTAQLVFIVQQRQLIDSQLGVAKRQEDRARPVLSTANALLGSPEEALTAARRAGAALTTLQRVLRAALDEDLVGTTTRALRRAPELLAAVDKAVGVLDRTYPTLRESLDVQRRTLAILEQSLAIQGETRDIARQTLTHTESIDRKTGGTAPPIVP
jgi:hypothetical protein